MTDLRQTLDERKSQYVSDVRVSSVHALHQEPAVRQRPVQAIHIERAPTPRGLTLGCDAEAGPRPVPEPQQPENPGRSSAAGHLAFSYSPTMGHAVPTEPPKEDSPCAGFGAMLTNNGPRRKALY